MRIHRIGIILILPLLISCNKVNKIYNDKEEVLNLFGKTDLLRRGTLYTMIIYTDSAAYRYLFEETEDNFEYRIDSLIDGPYSKKELQQRFLTLLDHMNDYGITNINSEFSKFGITLKLSLKRKEILYVEDVSLIENKEWLSYVRSFNKLDENWYWRKMP